MVNYYLYTVIFFQSIFCEVICLCGCYGNVFFRKRGQAFMLSNQVTLLVMILKDKVSLRAKRGNLMAMSLRGTK